MSRFRDGLQKQIYLEMERYRLPDNTPYEKRYILSVIYRCIEMIKKYELRARQNEAVAKQGYID